MKNTSSYSYKLEFVYIILNEIDFNILKLKYIS